MAPGARTALLNEQSLVDPTIVLVAKKEANTGNGADCKYYF